MKSSFLWKILSQTPMTAWRSLLRNIRLYYALFCSPAAPWHVKALMVLAVLYLLLPVDFIPDTIPVLGLVDDLAIVSIVLSYVGNYIDDEIRNRVDK